MTSIKKASSQGRQTPNGIVKTEQSTSIDESSAVETRLENKTLLKKKILLVEDNRINQSIILGVLNSLYLQADLVEDGLAALHHLKASQERYQLILMDCLLPELDGYQTTKLIRQGEVGQHYQTIPIIAITANVMPSNKEKCLAIGMNDFISKPIDINVLQDIIYHWLGLDEHIITEVEQEVTALNNMFVHLTTDQESSIHPELWCKDDFMRRARNNISLAKKLVLLFIEDAPDLLSKLITSIEGGHADEIVSYAHKLKGSARDLGGYQLGQLCEKIENNPRCVEKEQVNLQIKTLSKEFDLLMKALHSFIHD
jgi:two-component system, sensor histidine kinase and response regulator